MVITSASFEKRMKSLKNRRKDKTTFRQFSGSKSMHLATWGVLLGRETLEKNS